MKLNPDCIRDVMICLENATGTRPEHPYYFREVNARSLMQYGPIGEKYGYHEVVYTLIQLAESKYISMEFDCDNDRLSLNMGNVLYLTPKGHEFVAAMHDETIWTKKVLPALKSLGSVSLSIVEALASGATSAIIERLKNQS